MFEPAKAPDYCTFVLLASAVEAIANVSGRVSVVRVTNRKGLCRDAVGGVCHRAGYPSSSGTGEFDEYVLRKLGDPSDSQDSGSGGCCRRILPGEQREWNSGSPGEQTEGHIPADGFFSNCHSSVRFHQRFVNEGT